MTSLTDTNPQIPRPAPHVFAEEIQGETVLLDLQGEAYYSLNAVGTRIWQLLQQAVTEADLIETLQQEFEIDPATLRADVRELLGKLEAAGLVHNGD